MAAKREMTEEQKAALRERLVKAREAAAAKRAAAEEPKPVAGEPPEDAPAEQRDPEEREPVELSDAEMERIREEAAKKVASEIADLDKVKKKALIEKTLAAETLRQRREAGLTDYRDDMLDILIDVGPFADQIAIDGTVYQHARWYTVDRRRYDSLREIMARSWDAEDRAGNPNRKFRRTVADTMNPMINERRMSDGTLTMGLDTRVNGKSGAALNVPGV